MSRPSEPHAQGLDPRLASGGLDPDPIAFGAPEALPSVASRRPPPSALLGLSLILALAVGGFLWLNTRRLAEATPLLTTPIHSLGPSAGNDPPPALVLPRVAPETADTPPRPPETPLRSFPPLPFAAPGPSLPPANYPSPPPPRGAGTPVLIVDLGPATGDGARGHAMSAPAAAGQGGHADSTSLSDTEEFAQRVGSQEEPDRATATRIRNPASVVPQGVIIPAVLETAINSDLPGFARALVSRDVLSFDGSAVLIPRGSRLIGQYKSEVAAGQSRVFVQWSRVIRPDGASIQIGSPASDPLGRGGLEGRVDRRLAERFGGPILMSTLNAGLNALTRDSSSQVIIASPITALGAQSNLNSGKGGQISPVIKVAQGAPIRVFVARDLDFAAVGAAAPETR